MKKILKNKIFLIILILLIGCGVGVYATNTYNSNSVLYTTSDGESMSVNDALNDLYSNNITSNLTIKDYFKKVGYVAEDTAKQHARMILDCVGVKSISLSVVFVQGGTLTVYGVGEDGTQTKLYTLTSECYVETKKDYVEISEYNSEKYIKVIIEFVSTLYCGNMHFETYAERIY